MAIVGMDLGTTNSATAVLWMGRPEIIPNSSGSRTTPSVVGLTKSNEILVGQKAKFQRVTLQAPPIEEVKRQMGSSWETPFGDKTVSPAEISSLILRKLKDDAELFLQDKVDCAIVTIPAYFNESARRATQEAGALAGLDIAMVLDEPTAAALAYGIQGKKSETVLVYDLGGGTLDISIIEISGAHFEVIAIDGDNWLGGRDFDRILRNYVVDEVKATKGWDINANSDILSRLGVVVEQAKCDLSIRQDTTVIMEAISANCDICVDIKRELLEELIRSKVASSLIPVERALEKADLEIEDIDHILLVGGSTRIPLVREKVESFFGQAPKTDVHPDECVALGAAVYTNLLKPSVKKSYAYKMSPTLNQNLVVVPRTAHSMGIGTDEGGLKYSIVLPAGTFYPVSVTQKNYFTAVENQSGLDIWVYEGENSIAVKNTPLGQVRFDLPNNLPLGTVIWITFALNTSRILEVTVELPEHPQTRIQVTIDPNQNKSEKKTSLDSSQKREWESIETLYREKAEQLEPGKKLEIQWALQAAKEALDKGEEENIQKRMKILVHIRDFLSEI